MRIDFLAIREMDRIDFFNGYWSFLEKQGVASVILHSWQEYPEYIASDVDYCVPQEQLHQIIPLLDSYCQGNGWSLCQVFQHEKTAYFCVCASNENVNDLIMLDVCGDYTVRGVKRIEAEVFIRNRVFNQEKKFWTLNEKAELAYVVTKAAAKKKDPITVMPRVTELLEQLNDRQREDVLGYLPHAKNLNGKALYNDVGEYLTSSAWAEQVGSEQGAGCFELMRKVRRVFQPTGFSVLVRYEDHEDAHMAVTMLKDALTGTYRNSMVVELRANQKLAEKCKAYLAKVKSTLILKTVSNSVSQSVGGGGYEIQLPADWRHEEHIQNDVKKWALDVRSTMTARTRKRWL